jgi:predicted nuclease of predicted toxin-antitoxin system
MQRCQKADLDDAQLLAAAQNAARYKLAMADAIIWQTAQVNQAMLYTQDADLQDLPGVVYQAKARPGLG